LFVLTQVIRWWRNCRQDPFRVFPLPYFMGWANPIAQPTAIVLSQVETTCDTNFHFSIHQ